MISFQQDTGLRSCRPRQRQETRPGVCPAAVRLHCELAAGSSRRPLSLLSVKLLLSLFLLPSLFLSVCTGAIVTVRALGCDDGDVSLGLEEYNVLILRGILFLFMSRDIQHIVLWESVSVTVAAFVCLTFLFKTETARAYVRHAFVLNPVSSLDLSYINSN